MNTELYIKCVVACLLGNVIHICFKINSLHKDWKQTNESFSIWKYLKEDSRALLLDFASSFALVYLIDEWLGTSEYILAKIKTIFVFVGFSGSYVILQLASVAKNKFRKIVGEKSNISDYGTIDKPNEKI